MIDTTTNRPLHVSTDGTIGPYIMVPVRQLDELRPRLDDRDIHYTVDEDAISLDGSPEVAVVNFGRGADPSVIQRILDTAK